VGTLKTTKDKSDEVIQLVKDEILAKEKDEI